MNKSVKALALAISMGIAMTSVAQASEKIAFIPKLTGVGFLPVVAKELLLRVKSLVLMSPMTVRQSLVFQIRFS